MILIDYVAHEVVKDFEIFFQKKGEEEQQHHKKYRWKFKTCRKLRAFQRDTIKSEHLLDFYVYEPLSSQSSRQCPDLPIQK